MAPKNKGKKKQAGDWEDDLGETPDPTAAATQAAELADTTQEAEQDGDEGMDGGLLATLKKNKAKRAKKGKLVEDFVEGEDPTTTGSAPSGLDLHNKAPQEATMDDDDVFSGPNKKVRGVKKSQQEEYFVAEEADGDHEEDGLRSKKEKERDKKEREKQRKKEQVGFSYLLLILDISLTKWIQAAKKKAATPTPAPKEESAKPASQAKAEAPATATPEPTGKKKKVSAQLAAIQKQQEALTRQREEQARREAEEKAAEEERIRKEAEEEKRKEEARARKKEKEREKREQLKKEGKLLTKAEKERKAQQDLRMKQMLDTGVKIAGLEGAPAERSKTTFDKRRKGPKKQEEDLEAAAERARLEAEAAVEERRRAAEEEKARAAQEAEKAAEKEESDELDDWEKAADAEDVKDSWDAPSDEDVEPVPKVNASEQVERGVKADSTTNSVSPMKTDSKHTANGIKAPPAPSREPLVRQARDRPIESDTESEESSVEGSGTVAKRAAAHKKAEAAARRQKAHEEALAARSKDNLRSPICCILGHVDTGKTKLLDKIRQTNVQEGEAGGITQQIGATYFPVDALQQKTQVVNLDGSFEFKVPGLLVIDTPGHESFSNLRSRGSSLCNIAILVVDIMHGLEPQTLESMRLLRDRKTPFIVALNKIDRLYGWKKIDNNGFQDSLAMQNRGVQNEFRDRLEKTKLAFAEQGFNSELYYDNKSMARNVSLVPTSAHTGEGIPDMLKLLVTLTQERMTKQLMYLAEVECTVLEVKVIEGLGTTIDVILSNGILREGDGLNGAISTNIRALLTPAPLKELRLKSQYVHNKEVKASLGVKIAANDLEGAIAGSRLLVVGPEDDEEDLEDEVMADLANLLGKVSKDNRGVSVQASTLGSLEALLEFLKQMKIPVANISIGPVYKRDVIMAGTMLEKARQYAVMLCFDVKVDKEAQAYADEAGVKIFTADIIYHLFDDFTKHMTQLQEQKKEESKLFAVFPCVLAPLQVFNKKEPIIVGVDVVEGNLRPLTPIAAVKTNPVTGVKEIISMGRV